MAFLDVAGIRAKFSIEQNAYAAQIQSAIGTAGRKVKTWVSADIYAEAITDPPTDLDALTRYETVIDAHAFLTMYFLSISVGSKLSGAGFIKQAQDAKSVEGGLITNQYLTPAEMGANKTGYLNIAQELIEPYLTVEEVAENAMPVNRTRSVPVKFVF